MIILPGKCTSQFSQIASLGQRRILIIHPETSNFKQCYFLVKSLGRISCKMTIYVTTWANLQFRIVCHKSIIWRKKCLPKILTGALGYVSQAIHCDIMDSRASYPLRHLLVHGKKTCDDGIKQCVLGRCEFLVFKDSFKSNTKGSWGKPHGLRSTLWTHMVERKHGFPQVIPQ